MPNSPDVTEEKPADYLHVPQFRSFVCEEDLEYLRPVLQNNYIAEGPFAGQFRDKLQEIIGNPHGVLASNGTLALYLAMRALGIGPGDEVLVQDMTFIASANAVEMTGATPVFVDIPAFNDFSIDLDRIKLTPKTKAIVIAHLFGSACMNIEAVRDFCKEHNLFLVEDASQALAITDGTTHCGMFGDVGTFSFYADKTITTAEGGYVVCKDEAIYDKMVYLRNQGRKSSGTFVHPMIGYNFRMTDLQAALGLSQLAKLDEIKRRKKYVFDRYTELLGDRVEHLKLRDDFSFIPFRVVVFVDDAEKTMEYMRVKGVEPRSVFFCLHKQPCYEYLKRDPAEFPNSSEAFKRGICLPTWIGLSDEQLEHTTTALLQSLDQ